MARDPGRQLRNQSCDEIGIDEVLNSETHHGSANAASSKGLTRFDEVVHVFCGERKSADSEDESICDELVLPDDEAALSGDERPAVKPGNRNAPEGFSTRLDWPRAGHRS